MSVWIDNGRDAWELEHLLTIGNFDEIDRQITARWMNSSESQGRPIPIGHLNAIRFRLIRMREEYPTVKIATADWYDYTPIPIPGPSSVPDGNVYLYDNGFADKRGVFKGFGATYMSALYWERVKRTRLQHNLQWLSARGVNYIRALMMVGDYTPDDFWKGREIDPSWENYFEATLNDLFHDLYAANMRIELVLTDIVPAIPDQQARLGWLGQVSQFIEATPKWKTLIQHMEVMNESGRKIDDSDLAELTMYWNDISDIPISPSSPGPDSAEESIQQLFKDQNITADLLTPHFDRDLGDERYRPQRQPWEVQFYDHVNTHAFTNNEGIGCGSSVNTECDPARLAIGMMTTFISRGAGHVFHSVAGVRGDIDFSELTNAEKIFKALRGIMSFLPEETANCTTANTHWENHPFLDYDQEWPSTGRTGVVRAFAGRIGRDDYIPVMGVRDNYHFGAKSRMKIEIRDIYDATQILDTVELQAGQDYRIYEEEGRRDFPLKVTRL